MPDRSHLPGYRWRVLGHRLRESDRVSMEFEPDAEVVFDELVLGAGVDSENGDERQILHLEQMDERDWWMRLGDARVYIHVPPSGSVEVNISRGEYGPTCGTTEEESAP